jgi:hypothetical protein
MQKSAQEIKYTSVSVILRYGGYLMKYEKKFFGVGSSYL